MVVILNKCYFFWGVFQLVAGELVVVIRTGNSRGLVRPLSCFPHGFAWCFQSVFCLFCWTVLEEGRV